MALPFSSSADRVEAKADFEHKLIAEYARVCTSCVITCEMDSGQMSDTICLLNANAQVQNL